MKVLNMRLVALVVYALAYLLLFIANGLVLYYQKQFTGDTSQYLSFIHDGLIGLTAHILTVLGTPSSPGNLPNVPVMVPTDVAIVAKE